MMKQLEKKIKEMLNDISTMQYKKIYENKILNSSNWHLGEELEQSSKQIL